MSAVHGLWFAAGAEHIKFDGNSKDSATWSTQSWVMMLWMPRAAKGRSALPDVPAGGSLDSAAVPPAPSGWLLELASSSIGTDWESSLESESAESESNVMQLGQSFNWQDPIDLKGGTKESSGGEAPKCLIHKPLRNLSRSKFIWLQQYLKSRDRS